MTTKPAKELGFESEEERDRMVSNFKLTDAHSFFMYSKWSLTDGTKEGFLKLSEDNGSA